MKKTLLALCILCASQAFSQTAAVISSETQRIEVPSHEAHATQTPMGEERSLLIGASNIQGHGTRPLWELAPVKVETPLGDSARMLKQQHANARKADIVWEN